MAETSEQVPRLTESLRGLPAPVRIILLGTFINRFGGFVIFFLALYVSNRGYSAVYSGLAVGCYGVGYMLASFVGGQLADRVGRRRTILISMLSSAVVVVALSQAGGVAAILVLGALAGFTSELYRPASSALISDLVAPKDQLAAFGAYRFAINFGLAFGFVAGGLMAEESFTILFLVDAATSVLFAGVVLLGLPADRSSSQRAGPEIKRIEHEIAAEEKTELTDRIEHEIAGDEKTELTDRLKARITMVQAVKTDRRFQVFFIAALLIAFVEFQAASTFPLQVEDYGHSTAVYGGLSALNALIVVLFELPMVAIVQRFQMTRAIAVGFLLFGLGRGLVALSGDIGWLALTCIVNSIGEIIAFTVILAFVASLSPSHLRGRYQSVTGLIDAIGIIIGPVIGSLLYQWNHDSVWAVCGVLGVVAFGLMLTISVPQRQ